MTTRVVNAVGHLPNGSLVYYRGQPYFVSGGTDARIVTNKNGNWTFIHELKWKTVHIIHVPNGKDFSESGSSRAMKG